MKILLGLLPSVVVTASGVYLYRLALRFFTYSRDYRDLRITMTSTRSGNC